MKHRVPLSLSAKREAVGLSQAALARQVRIQQSHLRKIEMGKVSAPSIHLALDIAEALGVKRISDIRVLFPRVKAAA